MTSAGLLAVPDGQRRLPALRSRDLSGIRSRATSPISYTKHVLALREHIHGIGGQVWVARPTAGALLGFDDCPLARPYHLVVPRGRNIDRVGLVVHTARALDGRDVTTIDGLQVTSGTRTLIDLAATTDTRALTTYLDGALRDRTTTEDFLHRRLVELRTRGRAGIAKLLDVIAGAEAGRGGHSWLERTFLEHVAAAGLPRPNTQEILAKRSDRLDPSGLPMAGHARRRRTARLRLPPHSPATRCRRARASTRWCSMASCRCSSPTRWSSPNRRSASPPCARRSNRSPPKADSHVLAVTGIPAPARTPRI